MHLAYTSFFLCPPPMFWVVVGPCTELFAQAKCEIPWWDPNSKLLTCHQLAYRPHSPCLDILTFVARRTLQTS